MASSRSPQAGLPLLTQRQRKAIGTIVTLVSLAFWAAAGMWLYDLLLVGAANWVHLIFFVAFGLGWIVPAMPVIRWMNRPDA